jgi:hypothetical protein
MGARATLGAAVVCIALLTLGPASAAGSSSPTVFRAAFYYPWYPGAWRQQGLDPFTRYHPSLGFYNGGSVPVVAEQIAAMKRTGLDGLIASWFGPGSSTDAHVPTIVAALRRPSLRSFRFTLYYEVGNGLPPPAKIRRYATLSSYLRVDGKPVLFVYNASPDGASCQGVDELKAAAAGLFYLNLKVFVGFRRCASQPESWHQYGPAVRESHVAGYSDTISPGFFKASEGAPRLARSLSAWSQAAKDMVASREQWQLVTTFNEWGEGTAIEQSQEWGSSYLDALREAIRGRVR